MLKIDEVKCGLDRVTEYLDLVRSRRVGIIANSSSVTADGQFITDILPRLGADLKIIFTPEHGLFGQTEAGKHTTDGMYNGIKVSSLYGKKRAPLDEELMDLDLLIYDIQDVGCRFYTYISTMAMAMEKAAECGVPFMVLDRPCLRGGVDVSGALLRESCKSFVGYLPVTVSYAMTPGELALMAAGEGWIADDWDSITVIKLTGWKRGIVEPLPGRFIPPSPNLPTFQSVMAYPGLCFLEATNISEGRGTRTPFLNVGAPWCDGKRLSEVLNRGKHLPGVMFRSCRFTPVSSPGKSLNPKYKDLECEGISLEIEDPAKYKSLLTGLEIIHYFLKFWPEKTKIRTSFFNLLSGTEDMLQKLLEGVEPGKILDSYLPEMKIFKSRRSKYLLY